MSQTPIKVNGTLTCDGALYSQFMEKRKSETKNVKSIISLSRATHKCDQSVQVFDHELSPLNIDSNSAINDNLISHDKCDSDLINQVHHLKLKVTSLQKELIALHSSRRRDDLISHSKLDLITKLEVEVDILV